MMYSMLLGNHDVLNVARQHTYLLVPVPIGGFTMHSTCVYCGTLNIWSKCCHGNKCTLLNLILIIVLILRIGVAAFLDDLLYK